MKLETPWQSQWSPELVGTLVFVVDGPRVLLIHKKTGHGAGRINGPGGKLQPGESVIQCAARELREEVGITAATLECRCEMRFVETDGLQWLGFAFVAHAFQGTPKETAEALPFWCDIQSLPFDQMWPDDEVWLPKILTQDFCEGPPLVGNFLLKDDELLEWQFEKTDSVWQTIRYEDLAGER